MHTQSNVSPTAGQPITDLVLEHTPNGEAVWLRPEPGDEPRYVVTDLGRRARAERACFGPWPTVAEVLAS